MVSLATYLAADIADSALHIDRIDCPRPVPLLLDPAATTFRRHVCFVNQRQDLLPIPFKNPMLARPIGLILGVTHDMVQSMTLPTAGGVTQPGRRFLDTAADIP